MKNKDIRMKFMTPNALCKSRTKKFITREPETLRWIETFEQNKVFWDIGSNVGLYAIYAALKHKGQIYAFEPSIFNLEILARNISLNQLNDSICIIPFALCDETQINKIKVTSTAWGGTFSSFGKSYNWDGHSFQSSFEYTTIGLSMMDVVVSLKIPSPDYIKMDVDGIEHLILSGGEGILTSTQSILIEINEHFTDKAAKCSQILTQCGLVLKEKYSKTSNQIWERAELKEPSVE